jgi:long-chain acyl-CoA synthetase
MQVHELLIQSATASPDSAMVFDQDRWYAYGAVLRIARRVARVLVVEQRLKKGTRVGLYWENSVEAIAASFGIWIAGCVVVALNTDLRGELLSYQIDHCDAECVIVGRKNVRHLHPVTGDCPKLTTIIADGPTPRAAAGGPRYEHWDRIISETEQLTVPVRTIDIDLAAIVYTSGSTGLPKGVMLTHLNLVSNMTSIASYLQLTRDDRVMMVLPHFYIYGLSLLLTHTMVGGSIVIDNRFMYPNTVLDRMSELEVTGFAGVPSTFSILLQRSNLRETDMPKLRYVTQAGGAMPVAIQKEIAAAFHPASLFIMYGATEASPRLSYLEPSDLPRKWGSIGKSVDNVDLFVADADGNPVRDGDEGEIVARGSNITSGYWKDPEGSAAVLRCGLYFTGDIGRRDDEGFLYITGRAKDIIKVKGFRVSPKEIEECLVEINGVTDAAVIGVPDDLLGEAPVAFICTTDDDDPSDDAIQAALQKKLAAYKVPTTYIHLPALPKGAAGKILKTELKEFYRRNGK